MAHAPFGDVELMLREYLAPRGQVVSSLPPDVKAAMAAHATKRLIRVNRTGGLADATGTVDNPRVAILVLAKRDAAVPRAAYDTARQVETDLLNLPALTDAGRLDSARVESGPTAFPWQDPQVQAVQMIFRLSTRR